MRLLIRIVLIRVSKRNSTNSRTRKWVTLVRVAI
jgi:hypothetical protein